MDWNEVSTLLGVVHASQDVDPWFGQEARKRLNEIKAEATRPVNKVPPVREMPKPRYDEDEPMLGRRHS